MERIEKERVAIQLQATDWQSFYTERKIQKKWVGLAVCCVCPAKGVWL